MRYIRFYGILLIMIFTISCDNGNDPVPLNCGEFRKGLIDMNFSQIKTEIEKLTTDLKPKVSSSDEFGHSNNLLILIDRLNSQCQDLKTELVCYACIYTYPPQSEIRVSADSAGTTINRILDILTSGEQNLSLVRVHP